MTAAFVLGRVAFENFVDELIVLLRELEWSIRIIFGSISMDLKGIAGNSCAGRE